MAAVLLSVAALLALAHLVGLVDAALGMARVPDLGDVEPDPHPPRVSVVVAARNEERGIEAGVRSLLAQDVPELEVVVVDDRSDDGTPDVLARLCTEDPRLVLERVDELPPGWLGKTHALARGAERATGELLLFTDADVVFAPDAVRRGVALARARAVDHLTVAPAVRTPSAAVALLVGTFALLFGRFTRPWRAEDPRSRAFVGIGAFNLVRAEAYRAVGGHAPIRLRVDDDLRLGELLKRRGRAQLFATAPRYVALEWYPGVGAMVRGLTKNTFAAHDYRLGAVVRSTLVLILLFLAPFVAVAATDGAARVVFGLDCLLAMVGYAGAAVASRGRPWLAPLVPLGVVLFLWILWRSTLVALLRGSVTWRGTRYPLSELRAHARG